MLLRAVRVENFRGIRRSTLSFDCTTVLIGENDCGRSSLLEAVALVLSSNAAETPFRFEPFHFRHRTGAEPPSRSLVIELVFAESSEGEWSGPDFEQLRASLPGVLGRDRCFSLEVTGHEAGASCWTFRSAGGPPRVDDHDLLGWLRRRIPVFWLRGGVIADARAASPPPAGRGTEPITRHYLDLIEGTAPDAGAAIESGSAAARKLLLDRANLLRDHRTPLAEVLEGFTSKRKGGRSRSAPDPLRNFGTAAQNIGILLFVGTMLRLGAERVERGMDPLTLIENPEAHLHPMTLASIWNVIDRIGGQKIIATHSGTLLASARLSSVRRLTRSRDGTVKEWRVPEGALTADELRRYTYHLRSRRAAASFARCWILVEGETEFWLMGELARVCGYDLASEGVTCVEFAQCGLASLIKVAQHLGIEWHLLADGDQAGQNYADAAGRLAGSRGIRDRVTLLQEPDIEHCFWRYGYADVLRRVAFPQTSSVDAAAQRRMPPKSVIRRAIEKHSKPFLAVLLLDALIDRGPAGVPPPLKKAIDTCIRLARGCPLP